MFNRIGLTAGFALAAATIPATAAAPAAKAPSWQVDHSRSELGFSGIANGGPFTGTFSGWDAQIFFDADRLAASSAAVTIDTSTANTQDPSKDQLLPDSDWFAVSMFPAASFRTDSITADGTGGYVAEGKLGIRDVTMPVSLPFTLTIDGDTATMNGSLTLNRSDFGVGQGAYAGGSSVGLDVKVNVKVVAQRID